MLTGKLALVTGSTSGLGMGIIKVLAKNGADVTVHNIFPQNKVVKQIQQIKKVTKGKVNYFQADLIQRSKISVMTKQLNNRGGVDILVNNAGMQHISSIQNFDDKMWENIIQVDLNACFYLTKDFLPNMIKKGWGRIINISSVHGHVASIHKGAYIAAKHGLVGLTKVTALQNCRKGITANAVCPGWMMTDFIEDQIKNKATELNVDYEKAKDIFISQKHPSGKAASVDDIGQLVNFLCSKAADQINGTSYKVDGCWTTV